MLLDSSTRRNLELSETLREKQKRGSLLWVLDKTKTAMGGRTLRNYIEQPLIEKEDIEKRLDAVEELSKDSVSRDEIREYLNPIYDLERLLGRISYKTANPREITVKTTGNTALPAIVKSPTFACVKKISKNEVIIVALEDFTAIPTNNAIKLMLTVTADFSIN